MSDSLFRLEAVEHQKARLFGSVLLVQPASFVMVTSAIVAIMVALCLFLVFGSYARKETVTGYLVPEKGIVKVYSPQAGHIQDIYVVEGTKVSKDTKIAYIVSEQHADGQDVNKENQARLNEQINNLKAQQQEDEQKYVLLEAHAIEQKKNLERELKATLDQISAQKDRLLSADKKLTMYKTLEQKSYLEKYKVVEQEDQILQLKSLLAQLSAEQARLENQLAQLSHDMAKMPIEHQTRIKEKSNQILELESSKLKQLAQSETVIRSPIEGTVTSLQAHPGQWSSQTPLLSILPNDSALYANLFVPSRAIGFIKAGQPVKLRFDAYPYQRYGMYQGTIESVSKTVLSPNEQSDPVKLEEPYYRVKVALEKQTIQAFGQPILLTPGITVEADIILEKQSIFSWILSPLKRFKG